MRPYRRKPHYPQSKPGVRVTFSVRERCVAQFSFLEIRTLTSQGQLLQTVNIAQPFGDSKTIVDKPTRGSANQTLADFNTLAANGLASITEGAIVQFLDTDFVCCLDTA
jgi:hypothetical protein